VERFHDAFNQAIQLSERFYHLRRENLLLEGIVRGRGSAVSTVVLDEEGQLVYTAREVPRPEQLSRLRARIPEIPPVMPLRFFRSERGEFSRVTAYRLRAGREQYYCFQCRASQVPLRPGKNGIRTFCEAEAAQLFRNSFYSISGAMGMLDERVDAIAAARQPVMILGEAGTGKEQIARALYVRSPRAKSPLVVVDCSLMNEKNWDFLLNHYSAPLNEEDCTVYFKGLELLSEAQQRDLLSVIPETDLARRVRLLLSVTCAEGQPLPETVQALRTRLGCLTLQPPPLRSRLDELPSLASLYLSSLNAELGKQIIGFDPRAMEQLLRYEWPCNYTQFKQVLQELAALSDSAYIRGSLVAEVLARERRSYRASGAAPAADSAASGTLDQIIRSAVRQALALEAGNHTAAAKRLGISRTTLWRYLNAKDGADEKR